MGFTWIRRKASSKGCSDYSLPINSTYSVELEILWLSLKMDWRLHIISNDAVLLGKPTIKGTRISVELILDLMANGWTEKMIFESYPQLTSEDLKAVFAFEA